MITLAWWQALALAGGAAFVGFVLGITLMATFAMAGRADDAYEADRRMFGGGDAWDGMDKSEGA